MKMKANTRMKAGAALMLASFVWAGNAVAQDNATLENMDRPADSAASCNTMSWNQQFVTSYPWAAEACHTVVVVNGEKWARFEGEF